MPRRRAASDFIIGAVIALGAFCRFYHIGAKSLWYDEALVLLESQKGLAQLFSVNAEGIHPPLFRFLMHFWSMLGSSEAFVRAPSLVFGSLSILAGYRVARSLLGKSAAVYCALLMSISPFLVYYSQEVKMYSLLLLLSLCSVYFFIRVIEGGGASQWTAYILFTALSCYTNYFGIFNSIIPTAVIFWTLLCYGRGGLTAGSF